MKYAKAILLSIIVGVLLDILIDVLIPDHVMTIVFIVTMSVLVLGILLVVKCPRSLYQSQCEF